MGVEILVQLLCLVESSKTDVISICKVKAVVVKTIITRLITCDTYC